jgi:hypothetical protein
MRRSAVASPQQQRTSSASSSPATPRSRLVHHRHPHPNDININIQIQRSVQTMNDSFRPTNTSKVHEPKIEEFFGFCDSIYEDEPYKYNLSFEKVYRFMFYQSFREQKKRGKEV